MRADLHHPAVAPRRLDHSAAFVDRNRQRLLHVDVFAGVAGVDRLDRVPVIGGGDHDCIKIVPVDQAAEILVRLGLALQSCIGLGER